MEFKTIAGFLVLVLALLANESAGVPLLEEPFVPTTTEIVTKLCSRVTPCKWGVYGKDVHKRINLHIDNPTCICGEERRCAINEDNLSKAAFIYRCVTDETKTTTPVFHESQI